MTKSERPNLDRARELVDWQCGNIKATDSYKDQIRYLASKDDVDSWDECLCMINDAIVQEWSKMQPNYDQHPRKM